MSLPLLGAGSQQVEGHWTRDRVGAMLRESEKAASLGKQEGWAGGLYGRKEEAQGDVCCEPFLQ